MYLHLTMDLGREGKRRGGERGKGKGKGKGKGGLTQPLISALVSPKTQINILRLHRNSIGVSQELAVQYLAA